MKNKSLKYFFPFLFATIAVQAAAQHYFINNRWVTAQQYNAVRKENIANAHVEKQGSELCFYLSLKPGITFPGNNVEKADSCRQDATAQKEKRQEWIKGLLRQKYDATTLAKEGSMAPDFSARNLKGQNISISDYKGKVILLTFWAVWCGPCLNELSRPNLPSILQKFKDDKDFVFLPVAYTCSKEELASFFQTEEARKQYLYLSNISIPDKQKTIFEKYATGGIPRSFIIAKDGRIEKGFLGYTKDELSEMEKTLEALLSISK